MVRIACFDYYFNNGRPLLFVAKCVEVWKVCVKDTIYRDISVQLNEQDDHKVPPAVRGQPVHLGDQRRVQLDPQRRLRQHLQDPLRNAATVLVDSQLLVDADEVFEQKVRLVLMCHCGIVMSDILDQLLNYMITLHIRT